MVKADIRRSVLEKRGSLSEEESVAQSLIIQHKFLDTSFYASANVIASYSSFRGEVKTELITEKALSCGKKVVIPKIGTTKFHMDFISISHKDDLMENAYGVKEPLFEKTKVYAMSDIDLFIVPGVAYDYAGNRLGMGMGYYDRILDGISPDKIVALAYGFQLIDSVPSDSHDVAVGTIITEETVVETHNIKQGRRFIDE